MAERIPPLQRLIIYRNLLNDVVIGRTRQLTGWLQDPGRVAKGELESCFYSIWFDVVRKTKTIVLPDDLWRNYVLNLILEDENVFSLAGEKAKMEPDSPIWPLAVHDLGILKRLYNLNWSAVAQAAGIGIPCLPERWPVSRPSGHPLQRLRTSLIAGIHPLFTSNAETTTVVAALATYYLTTGSGDLGKYAAFRWKQGLREIENPDPIAFDDLVGYEEQKRILLRNTEAFINGYRANNVLLYGERGTGKSSSVKALLNRYACSGLRMIELTKRDLGSLPGIITLIRERGLRFIIFVDDLSFEDFEVEYKHLKASIEGSLEATPDNVLLYVTSNRRHLVKETWRDRRSLDEEVHVSDSHQEKLSLVDRFGITIRYPAPEQGQYLRIVQQLAQKYGLNLPDDDLKRKAIEWEMNYHGRSGRTAKQFITDLATK